MDHVAFIVQTFKNVFRQPQDEFERESWVGELTLQTRNVVAERVRDGANARADETLECELTQEMDNVLESLMKG